MNKQNKMGVAPIGSLVITMSLPLMVSMLIQSLYNIVDGIYVAKLSEAALTATSIAYPVQILMIAVCVGIGVGVNTMIAHSLGAGNQAQADQYAGNGLILSVLCSFLFIIFGQFGTNWFVRFFTDDALIAQSAAEYLRICLLFSTGIFLGTLGERLLQASGKTALSMIAQITGALINVFLDPVLIFGWWGLPALGIRGAAIATVIGQWGAGILALLLNQICNRECRLHLYAFALRGKIILDIFRVGVPCFLGSGFPSAFRASG